jgi:hypothetical protein
MLHTFLELDRGQLNISLNAETSFTSRTQRRAMLTKICCRSHSVQEMVLQTLLGFCENFNELILQESWIADRKPIPSLTAVLM